MTALLLCLEAEGAGSATVRSPEAVVFVHYWSGDFLPGVDAMVKTLAAEQPSLQLLVQGFEHEAFKSGVRAMLQSSDAPDLISYWAGRRTDALVDMGLLAPMDQVWQEHSLEAVFPPGVVEACTYQGRRYGVPLTMHWVGFFYNKALFQEFNLAPPRTWPEFLTVCEAIKRHGRAPLALGLQDKWPAQFWFDFLLARTAGPAFRERFLQGQESALDPRVRRVFTLWQELLDREYFLAQAPLYDWAGAAKAMQNGEAGMTLMGTWVTGLLEGKLGWQAGRDFDFFAFPDIESGVPRVNLGPIDLVLTKTSTTKPAVRQVLAAMASPLVQQAMSSGSGALSPSLQVPATAYSPMQQRILKEISASPGWMFAFDLATSEQQARAGLDVFERFHTRRLDAEGAVQALHRAMGTQ